MYCPECGKQNQNGKAYCESCGAALQIFSEPSSQKEHQNQVPRVNQQGFEEDAQAREKKEKTQKIVLIVCLVMVAIPVLRFIIFFMRSLLYYLYF